MTDRLLDATHWKAEKSGMVDERHEPVTNPLARNLNFVMQYRAADLE